MPTWVAGLWKKTRSPGLASAAVTALPACAWSCETRGSETPNFLYTYWTSPEQSKPDGLSPPHTYFTPRYFFASAMTAAAFVPELPALPTAPVAPVAAARDADEEPPRAETTDGSSPSADAIDAALLVSLPSVADASAPVAALAASSAEEKDAVAGRPNMPWIWAIRACTAATPDGAAAPSPIPASSLTTTP